jgi:5-hydroxyisourate hydrolase
MSGPKSYISTHMLNTARGIPAAGVVIEFWRMAPAPTLLVRTETDADGKARDPLLAEEDFIPGRHELRFFVGDYFRSQGLAEDPAYLDVVVVSVGLRPGQGHYHIPLLCSPWSYTTYRGS